MTQNYESLVTSNEESPVKSADPINLVNPIIDKKKTGFDPFDPISVKLMTLGKKFSKIIENKNISDLSLHDVF